MLPPTGMVVDTAADDVFVSDGELQFHRHVIVFNSETGAFKRMWGAYGNRPEDLQDLPPYSPDDSAPQQFRGPHCVEMSHDGLLYVCDRFNDRLQVFQKDGTFVTEKFIARDRVGVRQRVFSRPGAAIPVYRRRHEQESLDAVARKPRGRRML